MSTVPIELPAILHGAYLISQVGAEEWLKQFDGVANEAGLYTEPNWSSIGPQERKHWEAVAKQAVEFITGERVTA